MINYYSRASAAIALPTINTHNEADAVKVELLFDMIFHCDRLAQRTFANM